jgi:hypothetical protein
VQREFHGKSVNDLYMLDEMTLSTIRPTMCLIDANSPLASGSPLVLLSTSLQI